MGANRQTMQAYRDMLVGFGDAEPDEVATAELAKARSALRAITRQLDVLADHLGRAERAISKAAGR